MRVSTKDSLIIVSPALRAANNGNWQTAWRWSRFLRPHYRVALVNEWPRDSQTVRNTDAMIALHARRSAEAIARFAETHPDAPLVLVLTGTDLYRDIRGDPLAQRSLDLASRLVVLQEAGLEELGEAHRAKCQVIYQSAPALRAGVPGTRHFDVVMVGHLRAEKDPLTAMRALEGLPEDSPVRLIHIGDALTEEYLRAARALQAHPWPSFARYVWLGGRPHAETRQRIRRARALVLPSVMEGGANVIIEAVTAGVPVLASRISGNIGMLGRDYEGYFGVGDSEGLAVLLDRISRDRVLLDRLREQCTRRAPLFRPAREAADVTGLMRDLLEKRTGVSSFGAMTTVG